MQRKTNPFDRKGEVLIHPPPFSPLPTPATGSFTTSSSDAKISPAVLLVIVILAIAFFVCGLLHLLVRFLIKRPSVYSLSLSRRYSDNSASDALQRQLQQLFRLHDSGLDQDVIDALPVFCYKEIVGLKEPFDCAVCLCEFADQDQLRLLPVCSHAFHINCIDTWLLSNSTCPLCRNTLVCADHSLESRFLGLHYSRESSNDGGSVHSIRERPAVMEEEPAAETRVYSVRLGKYRSSHLTNHEETSSSNLDARRCYSMGSCEYVIGDSDLLVSLADSLEDDGGGNRGLDTKLLKTGTQIGNSMVDGDVEAKRISNSSKGESFSVSKIWQWSKNTNVGNAGSFHLGLPLTNKVQAVEDSV